MDRTDTLAEIGHSHVTFPEGMMLDCGVALGELTVAYRTYGTLNAARSNAVLICHALTLDQYVAERHPITGRAGWWQTVVGPGRPVDTDRFFVICANVLGGCMGSTGPRSVRDGSDARDRSLGGPTFRRSPSATWCGRRSAWSSISASLACSP